MKKKLNHCTVFGKRVALAITVFTLVDRGETPEVSLGNVFKCYRVRHCGCILDFRRNSTSLPGKVHLLILKKSFGSQQALPLTMEQLNSDLFLQTDWNTCHAKQSCSVLLLAVQGLLEVGAKRRLKNLLQDLLFSKVMSSLVERIFCVSCR